jgi:hypothetical protein
LAALPVDRHLYHLRAMSASLAARVLARKSVVEWRSNRAYFLSCAAREA